MKVIFHLSQSDPASSSLLQPLQVLCFLDSLRSAARKENPNSLVKIVACSIFFFFWPVHRIDPQSREFLQAVKPGGPDAKQGQTLKDFLSYAYCEVQESNQREKWSRTPAGDGKKKASLNLHQFTYGWLGKNCTLTPAPPTPHLQ